MIKKISLITLSCVLLATACSDVNQRATSGIETQKVTADEALSNIRSNVDAKNMSSVRHSDRVWLGSRGYRQQNGDPLPNKYDNITYITTQEQGLNEISSDLSAMTGMRFVVRDADSVSSSGASSDEGMDIGAAASGLAGKSIALSYSGDFVGLLNQLSTKFDIFWEHRENVIYLSKYVTRTLALYSLPSTTTLSSQISSESDSSESADSGGSGSGGKNTTSGTDNTVELETSLNVWEEVAEVIESMIPEGSTYAMSPSTGTLTITSSPLTIRKVENLIKKQNEILSRQVVVDVDVMSIVTSEVDNFKVDFSGILESISDNFNLNWSGPDGSLTMAEGLGNFSSSYLSDSLAYDSEDNFLSGSTADLIIDALSERFENSIVTNSTVTTLNNHTVPLQIITREAYVKQVEQSVDEGVITSSATPGDITTGFVMNVLPRILANGKVMMQYSMSISELTNLETKTFGDPKAPSFLQLPTVVSRDFLQNVKLESGNTLVLAGYDRLISASESSGTGNPDNYFFGGGKYGELTKEVLVIMITPRVIE
jgi:type IVB pilus formation R64 PilN family outer membrane protein